MFNFKWFHFLSPDILNYDVLFSFTLQACRFKLLLAQSFAHLCISRTYQSDQIKKKKLQNRHIV